METMMAPQPNGPAYFFYSPDPNPESRQHGRFIPQQHPGHPQMSMLPIVAPLPSTPIYSRPGSSCAQPPLLPKGYSCVPILPSTLNPVASPMPIAHKPTIVLDTELCEADGYFSPATPPLSSSGSVISSPGSCDMLQTPLNPMFSGLDGREACAMDGELERFPSLDWSACASPPLTPGKNPSLFNFILPLDRCVRACVVLWLPCRRERKTIGWSCVFLVQQLKLEGWSELVPAFLHHRLNFLGTNRFDSVANPTVQQ